MTRFAIPGGGKPTTIDHDELLKREADLARKRLLKTVDELDERKHEVESETSLVRLVPYAALALGGAWVVSGLVGRVRTWARRRRRRRAIRGFFRLFH